MIKELNSNTEEIGLRCVAQRALLGKIHPNIRSISFEIQKTNNLLFRVYFNIYPSDTELESMSCATTELYASYFPDWQIEEQFYICSEPEPTWDLPLIIYSRYESPAEHQPINRKFDPDSPDTVLRHIPPYGHAG